MFKKPPSDETRWICIYPAYLNAKKTRFEGRRIPKNKSVENPTCQEMFDICKNAGLNVIVEKKMYPRDPNRDFEFQGRLRVQLKNESGQLLNECFPSRESVALYIAELIPKLKSRQQRSLNQVSNAVGTTETNQQQPRSQGNKKKKR